jgi:BlaI family transcriptional regulator, penicillinase repressor
MRKLIHGAAKPTEFELELLSLLWDKDGATVRELHGVLSESRQLAYTTILKTLQIMTEKGLVKREEVGKAHVYRATRSRQKTQKQFVGDLSQRLFAGSAAQLVLHALTTQPVKPAELRRIKELIELKENGR